MRITNRLPQNLNHHELITRIKDRFGVIVSVSATHDESGRPTEIILHSDENLPDAVAEEIEREPEKTEQEEIEERQLQQGPFKKIMAELNALKERVAILEGR